MTGRPEYGSRLWLLAAACALIAVAVYLPTLDNGFVNFDDHTYVSKNPHLRSPDIGFIKWAFGSLYPDNWLPLVMLSYGVDFAIWGLDPRGYHLTNALLHGLNVFLVMLLAAGLFKKVIPENGKVLIACALVGAVFGLHPLHVESVAWVTERKDVLYALFWLLSLIAYVKFTSAGKAGRRELYYGLCLCCFLLSLMSKPMAVTLPAVLLILDYYPLGRLASGGRLFKVVLYEKLPFYVLSVAGSVVTIIAQSSGGRDVVTEASALPERLWLAVRALGFYLEKFFLPLGLAPFYPRPVEIRPLDIDCIGSLLAVLFITAVCIRFIKKRPLLMAAWAYFIITLLPTLGIVQVGYQAAADRYMYLPMLGPLMLLGGGAVWILKRPGGSGNVMVYPVLASIALLAVVMSLLTVRQVRVWKDSFTLWNHVMRMYPEDAQPYAGRGKAYLDANEHGRALEDFSTAIELDSSPSGKRYSRLYKHYVNRGKTYFALKQNASALMDFETAVRLRPEDDSVYYNRGVAYAALGRLQEAINDYVKAVSLKPDFASAYNNMATAYARKGDYKKAIENFDKAIALSGDRGSYYYNRGLVHEAAGNLRQAKMDYRSAARLGYGKPEGGANAH